MNTHRRSLIALLVSSAIAGCSGGGGGGGSDDPTLDPNTGGLSMPDRLSVVTANPDEPPPVGRQVRGIALPFAAIAETLPDSGAYVTDRAQLWVNDDSIRALGTVNMILCMVGQTRASDMVNVGGTGRYVALVNEDKCDEESSAQAGASAASSQNTTSSTSQSVNYNRWTVESTRVSETAPQIVKVWIPGKESDDPRDGQRVTAKLTITEAVSETRPFGSFEMVFEGYMSAPGGGTIRTMKGNLRTIDNAQGKPQFEFINLGGNALDPDIDEFSQVEKAAVLLDDADGTTGRALTFSHEEHDGHDSTNGYLVAFNPTHFLRGADDNSDGTVDNALNNVCTERTTFDTQVYQYNVYNTDGSLVTLNSGFPFRFTNTSLGHGNVGYWGVWTDQQLSLSQLQNQTIVRETWGQAGSDTYTLKVSAGRLQKRTRSDTTLDKIEGLELNWYGDPDGDGGTACALASDCAEGSYIAIYKDHDSDLDYEVTVTKSVTWNENAPPTYTDLATPQVLAQATGDARSTGEQIWFYSEALGGSVTLVKNASDSFDVVYYAEEWQAPVASLDGLQLACWDNCPKGGAVPSAPTAWTDLFYNSAPVETPQRYVVDVAGGVVALIDSANGDPVSWDGITDWSGMAAWSWLENGSRSGFMADPDNEGDVTNPWDVNALTVTYSWEMGPNPWNHTVAAVNGSGPVSLDRPRRFNYTYDPADDYNGATTSVATGALFVLEYGGPGQLWGFPWVPEDPTCTGNNCRWKSTISLLDGAVLNDGATDYLVRGMAKEQRMAEAALGDCAALSLDGLELTLPDTVVGSVGFTWSSKPNITEAPAVIEGEIQ